MSEPFVERVDDFVRIRRVLVSVSDKSGLDQLIPGLLDIAPIPNSTRRGDLSGALPASWFAGSEMPHLGRGVYGPDTRGAGEDFGLQDLPGPVDRDLQ